MKSNMPPKLTRMDSMAVARMGLEGFRRGEPLVVTGLRNKVMAFGVRLAPRRMVARVAKLVVTKKARGKKGN
jgi:short-subunit dehydrogenase